MNSDYKIFRDKAFSAFMGLAKECPEFEDAQMLVGSAESHSGLLRSNVFKSIDTEWIDVIEAAIPALDTIIRKPAVAIEDVDELLPVELSRHITEKSVKHLATHTNLILDISEDDDVTPQKLLNVYHDETYLTYENKFVNTLLTRLSAFVDKRYRALAEGSGSEQTFKFYYTTEFDHHASETGARNAAKVNVNIELTAPIESDSGEADATINANYEAAVIRIRRINQALVSYKSSIFAQKLGRNYIRPPVIRTNAILKNKNLKECLGLWEYIEGFDKVGYSVRTDKETEMPSDMFIGDLYSSVALQYVNFYNGVINGDGNRMLSKKHLFDTQPDFQTDTEAEEFDDFMVYDHEYRKMVPVSRLLANRKKLSDDEKRISEAISVALKADELIRLEEERRIREEQRRIEEARRKEEERLRKEEEARLAEEARIKAEEEARIRAAEEARLAEEARIKAEEEARRKAEEEERLRREEEERLRCEEEARLAEEARIRAEEEARIRAEEEARLAEEARLEAIRLAREERDRKLREEIEYKRYVGEKTVANKAARAAAAREAEKYQAKNTVKERRGGKPDEPEFVFSDEPITGNAFVIPYTREQYAAMPRKKKKSIMMTARKEAEKRNNA